MNEPVFENSMFTDDKSYERNSCVGLHSGRDNWLQTDALAQILPNYNTLRISLFWTNSQAVATDVSIYEVGNSYFDKWIPLENGKSFICSDYEVALVLADWEGRFERRLQTTSLLVIGSRVVF